MNSKLKLALVSLGLFGCVSTAVASEFRVATDGAYAPFTFTRADGTLDGFEVDVAKELCKRLNYTCTISAQEWDGMIPALQAGKYDAIIAGMSITPKREEAVDFSIPYQNILTGFATLKGSPLDTLPGTGETIDINADPAKLEALVEQWKPQLKGMTIGVQTSTIGVAFLEKYLKDTIEIKEYKSTEQQDLDLLAGRVDALFANHANFAATMSNADYKDMHVVGAGLRGGVFGKGVGVALPKGDTKQKEAFDKAIGDAIQDGTIRELSMKWLQMDLTPSAN